LSGLIAQNHGFQYTFAFAFVLSTLSLLAQPTLFRGQAHSAANIS